MECVANVEDPGAGEADMGNFEDGKAGAGDPEDGKADVWD